MYFFSSEAISSIITADFIILKVTPALSTIFSVLIIQTETIIGLKYLFVCLLKKIKTNHDEQ